MTIVPALAHRPRAAFTLVELLVSMAIIGLLMLVLVQITNETSKTWRSTTGKIEQFQEARNGFESMTRRLSQATLNTYWDLYYVNVAGRQSPTDYIRQSELRFVSGPMAKLTAKAQQPTHGVFFQAPLGFVDPPESGGPDYSRLENLLNTWGYFIEVGDDKDARPQFLATRVPARSRSRLLELMQPSQSLAVYNLDPKDRPAPLPGSDVSKKQLEWFTIPLAQPGRPVRVLAENIIALVIWPKLSKQEEDARRSVGKSVLAPNYIYDSSLMTFSSQNFGKAASPIYLNEGARVTASDPKAVAQEAAEINPKHQLPPVIQVTMVALDEVSAQRLSDASGKDGSQALSKGLFNEACSIGTGVTEKTQYEKDLVMLEDRLVKARLSYRVFTTNVTIRGAKWSASQTK